MHLFQASGKDGIPSHSTTFICASGDAKVEVDGNSCIKGEADQESVGEHSVCNPPTSSYNYYYPGGILRQLYTLMLYMISRNCYIVNSMEGHNLSMHIIGC